VPRQAVLSPAAARHLNGLKARERAILIASIRENLEQTDAAEQTRNRFRLRRLSQFAEFELRVEDLRLFYRVAGARVEIVMIGRKVGNVLIVDGRRFVL
jgi:mRNA-degrading endonuclease RelE of RelBE toxin-antitoxin system